MNCPAHVQIILSTRICAAEVYLFGAVVRVLVGKLCIENDVITLWSALI